jgi:hypothetical protein
MFDKVLGRTSPCGKERSGLVVSGANKRQMNGMSLPATFGDNMDKPLA